MDPLPASELNINSKFPSSPSSRPATKNTSAARFSNGQQPQRVLHSTHPNEYTAEATDFAVDQQQTPNPLDIVPSHQQPSVQPETDDHTTQQCQPLLPAQVQHQSEELAHLNTSNSHIAPQASEQDRTIVDDQTHSLPNDYQLVTPHSPQQHLQSHPPLESDTVQDVSELDLQHDENCDDRDKSIHHQLPSSVSTHVTDEVHHYRSATSHDPHLNPVPSSPRRSPDQSVHSEEEGERQRTADVRAQLEEHQIIHEHIEAEVDEPPKASEPTQEEQLLASGEVHMESIACEGIQRGHDITQVDVGQHENGGAPQQSELSVPEAAVDGDRCQGGESCEGQYAAAQETQEVHDSSMILHDQEEQLTQEHSLQEQEQQVYSDERQGIEDATNEEEAMHTNQSSDVGQQTEERAQPIHEQEVLMHNEAVRDENMHDEAAHDEAVHAEPVNEQMDQERVNHDPGVHDQVLHDHSTHQFVNHEGTHAQVAQDHVLREEEMHDEVTQANAVPEQTGDEQVEHEQIHHDHSDAIPEDISHGEVVSVHVVENDIAGEAVHGIQEQQSTEQADQEHEGDGRCQQQEHHESGGHEPGIRGEVIQEQIVHAQSVHAEMVDGESLQEHVEDERAVVEQAVHEQAVHEETVHEETVHEETVHEQAAREHAVHEQAVHEQAVHEQAVHEQAVHEQAVLEQAMHEQVVHDQAMRNEAVQDEVVENHDRAAPEDTVHEEVSSEHVAQQEVDLEQDQEHVNHEQVVHNQTDVEEAVHEQMHPEQSGHEQALHDHEQAVPEEIPSNQGVHAQAVLDQEQADDAMREQAQNDEDQTMHEQVMHEQVMHEQDEREHMIQEQSVEQHVLPGQNEHQYVEEESGIDQGDEQVVTCSEPGSHEIHSSVEVHNPSGESIREQTTGDDEHVQSAELGPSLMEDEHHIHVVSHEQSAPQSLNPDHMDVNATDEVPEESLQPHNQHVQHPVEDNVQLQDIDHTLSSVSHERLHERGNEEHNEQLQGSDDVGIEIQLEDGSTERPLELEPAKQNDSQSLHDSQPLHAALGVQKASPVFEQHPELQNGSHQGGASTSNGLETHLTTSSAQEDVESSPQQLGHVGPVIPPSLNTPVSGPLQTSGPLPATTSATISHQGTDGTSPLRHITPPLASPTSDHVISQGVHDSTRRAHERYHASGEQLRYLIQAFETDPTPSAEKLNYISQSIGMPMHNLVMWFKNRRARHKRSSPMPTKTGRRSYVKSGIYSRNKNKSRLTNPAASCEALACGVPSANKGSERELPAPMVEAGTSGLQTKETKSSPPVPSKRSMPEQELPTAVKRQRFIGVNEIVGVDNPCYRWSTEECHSRCIEFFERSTGGSHPEQTEIVKQAAGIFFLSELQSGLTLTSAMQTLEMSVSALDNIIDRALGPTVKMGSGARVIMREFLAHIRSGEAASSTTGNEVNMVANGNGVHQTAVAICEDVASSEPQPMAPDKPEPDLMTEKLDSGGN